MPRGSSSIAERIKRPQQSFLQHALLTGILASIACGIIGSYVVTRRITYIAGGIAHSVLAGMGAAYLAVIAVPRFLKARRL